MEVDSNLVIQKLLDKIKDLNLQIALLEVAINFKGENKTDVQRKSGKEVT